MLNFIKLNTAYRNIAEIKAERYSWLKADLCFKAQSEVKRQNYKNWTILE